MALASITSFIQHNSQLALVLLFVLVALESFGLPLPGETALTACAVLASQGALSVEWVIVVASAAAIIGDNLGYLTARIGGRRVLDRFRFTRAHVEKYLPRAERFFERWGGPAVFFARFVSGLRVTAALAAGLSEMEWRRFLFWNAAGGILWATAVGLAAYFLGDAFARTIGRYGLYAAAGVIVLGAIAFFVSRHVRHRVMSSD